MLQTTRASRRTTRGFRTFGISLIVTGALICSIGSSVASATIVVDGTSGITAIDAPPVNRAQARPCPTEFGEPRVGLVIDQGTFNDPVGGPRNWPSITWSCTSPIEGMDNLMMRGTDVLLANGHDLRWHANGLLCSIDGYPANGCAHETAYWSYWLFQPGMDTTWGYADRGPAFHRVQDEMVLGWRYITLDTTNVEPPRIAPAWDLLCCIGLLGATTSPRDLVATPTQDGALLTWTAPDVQDDLSVSSYIISVLPEDQIIFESTSNATIFEVTDLPRGSAHSFQVRAITNHGETTPSDPSAIIEIGSGALPPETTSTTSSTTTSTSTTTIPVTTTTTTISTTPTIPATTTTTSISATPTIPDTGNVPSELDPWDEAFWAADWLVRELDSYDLVMPSFSPGSIDWGITLDALLALAALDLSDIPVVRAAYENMVDHINDYTTWDNIDGDFDGVLLAGQLAKVLLTTTAFGDAPSDLRNTDYESVLRNTMRKDAPQVGRFSDINPYSADNSNMFGQSLAMMTLSYTHNGIPDEAVGFLLEQQCPDGGFRLFFIDSESCNNNNSDTDATALALQALAVSPTSPSVNMALSRGVGYLLTYRDSATGAFGGTGPTAAINANSSGLIAQTLRGLGHATIADAAGSWIVKELQIPAKQASIVQQQPQQRAILSPTDHVESGAIAYRPAARTDALVNGIDEFARDQWRRATTQAVFAMELPMYSNIGADRTITPVDPTFPTDPPGRPSQGSAEPGNVGNSNLPESLEVAGYADRANFNPSTSPELAWTGSESIHVFLLGVAMIIIGSYFISRPKKTISRTR